MLHLYSYYRSSAAYRVRIALNLKGLPFETIPVHLLENGGEQHSRDYNRINPAQLVPALQDGNQYLSQSMAIMEYLEDICPTPALLPGNAIDRARVRAMAQLIACDIHPLNNLRVLQYLENVLGVDEAARSAWYEHWIHTGFTALEQMLAKTHAHKNLPFCAGDTPGLADCYLVPQMANARRMKIPLQAWPTLCRIEANCLALCAFAKASPDLQPDAPRAA